MDSSGNLYGTTTGGGASNDGTVFEIVHGTNIVTTLATFNGANGASPYSNLVLDSSGNVYGTTTTGGAHNAGTVFEIAAGSLSFATLASFGRSSGNNDLEPHGNLVIDSSGNLYGTTEYGADSTDQVGDGTVFEVAAGTSVVKTIAQFEASTGNHPYGGLTVDSNGNLFGTTRYNDDANSGDSTIFEIAAGTSTLTTLASLNGTDGLESVAGITIDRNGNLFGTASTSSYSGPGTVFELPNTGSAINPAYSSTVTRVTLFAQPNQAGPYGSVLIDSAGNLYGTTIAGGPSNRGTVYEIPNSGTAAVPVYSSSTSTLVTFTGTNGQEPVSNLVRDSNGDFYGITEYGGTGYSGQSFTGDGTVFELTPTGSSSAPEPAALALCMTVAIPVGLAANRRRRVIMA
jgi:uncharacterized repeat protein (TIGR03803 family)